MTQIQKKWIGDDEIGSSQVLIERDQGLRAVDQTDAVVDLIKINAAGNAEILGKELVSLEAIDIAQVIHVEKGGDDATADGSLGLSYQTIQGALAGITDASPTKRYVIKVAAGTYAETGVLALKANVFIVGDARDSVRISAGSFTLDASFSGSADNRSGFSQCILLSACDFDWSTVTSAAGKLYFNEVSFSSTVRLYGHNNAIAQAMFNSCIFFGALTISGINVGSHTNCIHYANILMNQHPNGGMATILNAAGGSTSGIILTTTVSDFNRRCSLFAKNFWCDSLTVDGPSSYADGTVSAFPRTGATKTNGGTIVQLNEVSHSRWVPNESNAHNLGDWGKQWMWNFAYVQASSGTDLYVGTYPESFGADTLGKTVYIMPDLAGLAPDTDGGNVELETAAVSGTGVRGKVKINARELDMTSSKVTHLASGTDATDAVNKGQLDLKLDATLKGAVDGLAELDGTGKVPSSQLPSYVDDVVEYENLAAFPALGATGLIYVALDSNKTYRWSGSTYVEISAGPASTDALGEGSTNLYFTDARAKTAAVVDSMAGSETDQAPSVSAVKAFITSAGGVVIVDDEASLPDPGNATKLYVTKDADKLWYYKEIGGATSYDFTVGSGGDFATLEAALADSGVVNGSTIQVLNGTYSVASTINVSKSVKIYGESKAGVIFETAGASGDPVSMFNVSVDDVLMKDMTIKHKKTSNTSVETAVVVSGPGFPQTRVAGFIMDNCRIEHVEFALTIRGSAWKIANTQFAYAGPTNSTRRHVGIYGVSGDCFAYNCQSEDNGASGNTRWFAVTSTTGTNPNETLVGSLVLEGNVQTVGALQQFYSQDAWQGTAGSYSLYAVGNTTNETSAFLSLYGTVANFADILAKVQVSGNTLSNLHGGTPAGGKGLIGFDGAGGVAARSSALPVNSLSNSLGNLVFRTDYVECTGSSGAIAGRHATNLANVTVTLSGTLDSLPSMPTTPSAGGGTTYEYTEISAPQPFANEKFVLTSTDITNQYITLQHQVKHESITAFANRLAIHPTDDYTVSVVSNKTRLTFAGEIATGGLSALVAGDVIRVNYTYPA